jgi:hypothetical protein
MTDHADLWKRALPRWIRLADLWAVVESVFGVSPAQAIRILRSPLEAGEITALVPDWRNPRQGEQHAEMKAWVVPGYSPLTDPTLVGDTSLHMSLEPGGKIEGDPEVSPEGWKHVDHNTGTLNGFDVLVSGPDVERVLLARIETPIAPSAAGQAKRNEARPTAQQQGVVDGFFFAFHHARRGGNAQREDAFGAINAKWPLRYRVFIAAYANVPEDVRNADPKKRGKTTGPAVRGSVRPEAVTLPAYRHGFVEGFFLGFQFASGSKATCDDAVAAIHGRTGWLMPDIEAACASVPADMRSPDPPTRGKAHSGSPKP